MASLRIALSLIVDTDSHSCADSRRPRTARHTFTERARELELRDRT
jgi:hypothetical protein